MNEAKEQTNDTVVSSTKVESESEIDVSLPISQERKRLLLQRMTSKSGYLRPISHSEQRRKRSGQGKEDEREG